MEGTNPDKRKVQLVVCAIIVADNKVLLIHHAKLKKWLPPGGHIDENETPDQAVVREVKEETGLDFILSDYGPVRSTADIIERTAVPFHTNVHNVGDHDHYCSYYLGTVKSTEAKINKESTDMRWVNMKDFESLVGNLPENIKEMVRFALSRK
ncbi:MAG: NUDIX hydrolase [Candidatus Micrarchaeales archaeon]